MKSMESEFTLRIRSLNEKLRQEEFQSSQYSKLKERLSIAKSEKEEILANLQVE